MWGMSSTCQKTAYDDASKGISNDVIGLYTEYAKVVFEQRHETCYLTAQTCMITGHKELFKERVKKTVFYLAIIPVSFR